MINYIIIDLQNAIFQELLIEKISSMVDGREICVCKKTDFSYKEGQKRLYILDKGYSPGEKIINIEMCSNWKSFFRKLLQLMEELQMPFTDYMEKILEPDKKQSELLTKREKEVIFLIAKGMINKEIAEELHITEQTVKNHISNIFKKLNVYDRTQVAVYAIKNGIYQM